MNNDTTDTNVLRKELLHSTAMLNAAIRIVRTLCTEQLLSELGEQYAMQIPISSILDLWSEQVKVDMALLQ